MYESEVSDRSEPADLLPVQVVEQLRAYRQQIATRTVLPWGEHCTECAWPSCYRTCDLYDPRIDGGCRQFEGGVVRVATPDASSPYLQKITFRRWAKLWTVGRLHGHSTAAADRAERVNIVVGGAARLTPLPASIKERALRKIAYLRRQHLVERAVASFDPNYLVFEIYNPSESSISLTLSVRERGSSSVGFQKLVRVGAGLNRERTSCADIRRAVSLDGVFEIELVPNDAEGVTLYFGLIDFVQERSAPPSPTVLATAAPLCKCVVWDLDHTLWDGILVEDGADKVRLREGIRDIVTELDRRGILQSIASKNNREDALSVLDRLGLAEYFLYPQIHWQPKSASVAAIAKALNIGVDTLLFVDDQEFERQEVSSALQQVRTIDASAALALPSRPECQVPVTEESRRRRLMYRQEEQRLAIQQDHGGDYIGFLRQCGMVVELARLSSVNLQRVYELAQRTNQMNFSGNRYTLQDLQRIMADGSLDSYVLRCADRFGSYGIVGFALVASGEPRLLDLMFSCRVQSKRVEHAFLGWLLRKSVGRQERDFWANLRKTPKNAPSSVVFAEMGFEETGTSHGVTSLRYRRDRPIVDEGVVEIRMEAA